MISLRPYQKESLEAIHSNKLEGILRQVIHLPTGAGKTVVFSSLIAQTIKHAPKTRALVLAFSCDLLGQAKDKLKMIAPELEVGIVSGVSKEFDKQVVISSIQSARQPSALEKLKAQGFSIVICDECHHFASDSARFVLDELGFSLSGCIEQDRLLIGFSATPFRNDSKGLGEIFDKIIYTRTIKEMIDDGYLCRPSGHKVITDLNLSQIAIENGDFSSLALSRVMNTDSINETIVQAYIAKRGIGLRTIAFCTNIAHALKLSSWFQRFGISSDAIHSELSVEKRESLKKRFQEGEIEVLVNPTMLTEGYDEPSISCVIVARPTKSSGLYQQMLGRGLRLHPSKKECLVLDFSDQNHSLCNLGILLENDLQEGKEKSKPKNEKIEELVNSLPKNINPKLKKAILELDLLGENFSWKKDYDGIYYLKGSGEVILKVIRRGDSSYEAVLFGAETKVISSGLDFEYSFCAAEDFARANSALFVISDLSASWRSAPISEKQKNLFRSYGFKNGIENLSRGQAATIISSGILRRKKRTKK